MGLGGVMRVCGAQLKEGGELVCVGGLPVAG